MAMNLISKFTLSDRVLIAAPENSLRAKHNGQVGTVTGFIENYLVKVNINGETLHFRPDELTTCFKK